MNAALAMIEAAAPKDEIEAALAVQMVAETVQRFGGFVAKYMGDGVLACSSSGANKVAHVAPWAAGGKISTPSTE